MADGSNEELEYYIKFPSATAGRTSTSVEYDSSGLAYKESKLPVVILLGWAGCRDKYLAKYSAIYEERGCITLRCTAPVMATFMRHDRLRRLGKKLLALLHDMSLDEHPIFFHIFSNGGAFFYQQISSLMRKQTKKLQVKGAIFDSAPGRKRFYSIYKALSAIIGGSPWYNIPLAVIVTLCLYLLFLILTLAKGILYRRPPHLDPLVLVDEPFRWPQLFIYSKNDDLVKVKDVDKFSLARERKGVRVVRLRLEDSPHVQHLLTNREVYIMTVMNFLQECLN